MASSDRATDLRRTDEKAENDRRNCPGQTVILVDYYLTKAGGLGL